MRFMEISANLRFKCYSPKANLLVIDGKLTKVSDVYPIYDLVDRVVRYSYVTPDGKTCTTSSNQPLYESEIDFQNGEINQTEKSVLEVLSDAQIPYEQDFTTNKLYPYVWKFAGGQPVKEYINFLSIRHGGLQLEDGLYLTRKECLDDNDYVYVDGDGVEHVRKSIRKQVMLNGKQREIMLRLKAVLDEATEANIQIVSLAEFGCLCAINADGVIMDYRHKNDDFSGIDDVFLNDHCRLDYELWGMGCDDFMQYDH